MKKYVVLFCVVGMMFMCAFAPNENVEAEGAQNVAAIPTQAIPTQAVPTVAVSTTSVENAQADSLTELQIKAKEMMDASARDAAQLEKKALSALTGNAADANIDVSTILGNTNNTAAVNNAVQAFNAAGGSNLAGPRHTQGSVVMDNNANLFLIGDSRTVMGAIDTGYDKRANWYATSGSRRNYLTSNIAPLIDAKVLTGKTIVIMYGINDILFDGVASAKSGYRSFLMTKGQEWAGKGATVYFALVPGVTSKLDVLSPGFSSAKINAEVNDFNTYMRSNLPANIKYLPIASPASYDDGLHYTKEESARLYRNIINLLASR